MDQERRKEAKLKALRAAIEEGENSGDAVELDIEEFVAQMEKRWTMRKLQRLENPPDKKV